MDGGFVRDLLSLKHVYTTLREIFVEPEEFAKKVRTGGFLEITRPVPFVTACVFILAIASKLRGKTPMLSSLSTAAQLEIVIFFFLPFATIFHLGMKSDRRWSSATFGASICAWLYVLGLLALVFSLFVVISPYLAFLPRFAALPFMVLSVVVLGLTVLVMVPLYEATDFDEVKYALYGSAFIGVLVFFGSRKLYPKIGLDPSVWLAESIERVLH